MGNAAALTMGGLAALYLLWCATWLVLGDQVFGAAHYNWDQTLVAAVAAVAALAGAWRTVKPYRLFLVLIGLGLVLLALSWSTYEPDGGPLRFSGAGAPDYSAVAYAAFVFVWICAWGYLTIEQWHVRPPSTLTGVVFALLMVGLAGILTSFYYPEYRSSIDTNAGRLDAVTSGLEFIALILGLGCILLGQRAIVTWALVGATLLLAGDMAYSETDVPDAIAAVWQLGQFILLATALLFPHVASNQVAVPPPGAPGWSGPPAAAASRSGLSGVLILISLGCVLLLATLGLTPLHAIWKSFSSVLFVVGLVVAMAWLTDRFDEAIAYLKTFTASMLRDRLQAGEWRDTHTRVRAILQSTGLGAYLDDLRDAGGRLKQDVLFLGPERLYPPPRPAAPDRIRCFIVMPFSMTWSNDVHHALASACRRMSVHPVRGDDVFTPTDILNDIWHSIHGAAFVIADITGRNANVMYELGIAHTLGKPVLIISRNHADIPIDLSTRRVILYGEDADWTADLEMKVARAVGEILSVYGIAPPPRRPVDASLAPAVVPENVSSLEGAGT
jgi:hypothetical protein